MNLKLCTSLAICLFASCGALSADLSSVNLAKEETFAKGKVASRTEAKGGSWHGYISYTLQGKAFGLKRFWAEGSGLNFRTENLDHSRFSRPANPEYLETYFDKKTKKTLTWDGSAWVDAMGNPAD